MSIIPILSFKLLMKVLLKAGFRVIKQSGSHVRFKHINDPTRQTTVPQHSGDIPKWLLREILKQAKISTKDLLKFLKD